MAVVKNTYPRNKANLPTNCDQFDLMRNRNIREKEATNQFFAESLSGRPMQLQIKPNREKKEEIRES